MDNRVDRQPGCRVGRRVASKGSDGADGACLLEVVAQGPVRLVRTPVGGQG